jgi:hypothetical protein
MKTANLLEIPNQDKYEVHKENRAEHNYGRYTFYADLPI